MPKLAVVENDKVEGTDKHNVTGNATNPAAPPPTVPYVGVGDFDYKGKMTDGLSDFVKIGGKPVATVQSKSSLDPGQTAPGGGHHPTGGKNWLPPAPAPIPTTLSIPEPIGEGRPSAVSGSTFVKVGGQKLLLDGDKIDTCDGLGVPMNSTVTAEGQSFVSCSA
ncbi:MAG TPA: hypothetical protein VF746_29430 [Longimicrobium sp.]